MTVSVNTPDRLVFGAGTLTVGADPIGATMEGTTFRVEKDISTPHFHGVRGPLKRGMFASRVVAYLEVTVPEIIGKMFLWGLPGATMVSNVSSEKISGWVPGCIPATAYRDVILTVTKCTGLTQVVTLKDAIVVENLEITYDDSDGNPATIRLVFMSAYNAANPTIAPFTIVNNIA